MNILPSQIEAFDKKLENLNININRNAINSLQINIGKRCNQSCIHCHVNAGPARTEEMKVETMDRIISLLKISRDIATIDITGGAPELNENFGYLINKLRDLNVSIIDRCNLSVLFEKGQENTPSLLAKNKVAIIASLPCYTEENVDLQRGPHTYNKSISALKLLNNIGYGQEKSGLILNLVYNPGGAFLPTEQKTLELTYKEVLKKQHGIVFNHLFTITNMPINRFAHTLIQNNEYDAYCNILYNSFNPQAAENVMCRNQLSIAWNGEIFDCDFNQALNIPIRSGRETIWSIDNFNDVCPQISFSNHCYGCTAGGGSSCLGSLAE